MKSIESLYIHFPYCKHLCNYCDFYKQKLSPDVSYMKLHAQMKDQWDKHQQLLLDHSFELVQLKTLYLGGGTPSLWSTQGARFLSSLLGDALNDIDEFTIEVDPDAWTEEGLSSWRSIGANRFSIGVQSFDSNFLKIMDRQHSMEEITKTLRYFSQQKLNYSVDLMIGLPFSEKEKRNIERELEDLLEFNPRHFSVYILKPTGSYPYKDDIPEDDFVSEEYMKVSSLLRSRGYIHYEVSNFAIPGFESHHNQQYWCSGSVAAIGPNATGFLNLDERGLRYQWKTQSSGFVTEDVAESSFILEKMYLGLRTSSGFDFTKVFDQEQLKKLEEIIPFWQKRGFIQNDKIEALVLTPGGFLMIDSIMDDIFGRIQF